MTSHLKKGNFLNEYSELQIEQSLKRKIPRIWMGCHQPAPNSKHYEYFQKHTIAHFIQVIWLDITFLKGYSWLVVTPKIGVFSKIYAIELKVCTVGPEDFKWNWNYFQWDFNQSVRKHFIWNPKWPEISPVGQLNLISLSRSIRLSCQLCCA